MNCPYFFPLESPVGELRKTSGHLRGELLTGFTPLPVSDIHI